MTPAESRLVALLHRELGSHHLFGAGVQEITPDTPIHALRMNLPLMCAVCLAIEEEFGISLGDFAETAGWSFVRDVVASVERAYSPRIPLKFENGS